MADAAKALAEYVDADGNTFQMTAAHAERLGYTKVGAKATRASQTEDKVIGASSAETTTAAPARRRSTTTK